MTAEWVTWRLPPDTPWWRFFRRSWERNILGALRDAVGDGPFRVLEIDGDVAWIELNPETASGVGFDFSSRWLQPADGGDK